MTLGSTRSAVLGGERSFEPEVPKSVQNAMLNSLSRVRQPMITEIDTGARHVPVLTPIALMLTVLLVAGCHSLAHPKDLRSVSVSLKRTACYGTCPVYSVLIHGNGLVEYLGELNVDVPGDQTGRIPPEKLIDLLRDFEGIHFFDLQDRYSEACTDQPTAIISILVDGKNKEVSNYFGGCEGAKSGPQVDLARLAEQIDKAAGSGRWVKCDFDCVEGLVEHGFNVTAQAPGVD